MHVGASPQEKVVGHRSENRLAPDDRRAGEETNQTHCDSLPPTHCIHTAMPVRQLNIGSLGHITEFQEVLVGPKTVDAVLGSSTYLTEPYKNYKVTHLLGKNLPLI